MTSFTSFKGERVAEANRFPWNRAADRRRKRGPYEVLRNPKPSAPAGVRLLAEIHREDRPGEEGSDKAILPRRRRPVEPAASKR
jgi:hypothetical protein